MFNTTSSLVILVLANLCGFLIGCAIGALLSFTQAGSALGYQIDRQINSIKAMFKRSNKTDARD